MRTSVIVLLVAVIAAVAGLTNPSAAADECLSRAQLHDVTRMASVMGIGAAVRRCGHCLGADEYARTLEQYDAAGLMRDFSAAQVTLAGAEPRSAEYGDIDRAPTRTDVCGDAQQQLRRMPQDGRPRQKPFLGRGARHVL